MNIGILTFHCAHNYGAILQCYSLQQYLLSLGHDVEVIDYRPYFLRKSYRPFARHRIELRRPFAIPKQLLLEVVYNVCRWLRFERFIRKILLLSKRVSASGISNEYDVYVFGSDQIWSEHITAGDTIYMGCLPFEKKQRIYMSYAASIELAKTSDKVKKRLVESIATFDTISVREENSADWLRKELAMPVEVTCDPVLLQTPAFWNSLARHPRIDKKYVLLYQVREDKRVSEFAQKLAKRNGLKLVQILAEPVFREKKKFQISNATPDEFIGLIRHAKCVVTSSFHATVFSVLFERSFLSVSLGDGMDMRVKSFLTTCGLDKHLVSVNALNDMCLDSYSTDVSDSVISEIRSASQKFLKNSLVDYNEKN